MADYDVYANVYDAQYTGYTEDISFYVGEAYKTRGPVLELACGTGRVLLPCADAGALITGLDLSPAMLSRCKEKLVAYSPEVADRVRLVVGDMRCFKLPERFELVTIPFRSFLLLLTVQDQLQALATIREHLADSGRFVFNIFVPDISMIAARSGEVGEPLTRFREFLDPQTGHRIMMWDSRHYSINEQLIENVFIYDEVDEAGQVVRRHYKPLKLRWMYRYETEHLLARSGFAVEALYGGFNRQPFDENSREMVWVTRKK
jgi:SAM-dependent methyltransferase